MRCSVYNEVARLGKVTVCKSFGMSLYQVLGSALIAPNFRRTLKKYQITLRTKYI